jgi:hypothetical protein
MLRILIVVILIATLIFFSACTNINLTLNVVHTQGRADDVVDDTDDLSCSPKVDTSVQVPLHPL